MISFTAEVTRCPAGVKKPTLFRRTLHAGILKSMSAVMDVLRKELARASPKVSGELRESWVRVGPYQGGLDFQGGVVSRVIQSAVIDTGARPHNPTSPAAIERISQWVQDKLPGNADKAKARRTAFAVARAIERRGLPSERNRGRTRVFSKIVGAYDQQVLRIGSALHDAAAAWGVS